MRNVLRDAGGSATLTFNHTLANGGGNYRLVLVGYVCRGKQRHHLHTGHLLRFDADGSARDDHGRVHQLLGALLPAGLQLPAGGTYTVTINPPDDWTGYTAQILELSGVEQSTFYAAYGGHNSGSNCGAVTLPPT